MSNILNNTTSLQEVLEALQTKAAGGEQATPVILVNSSTGLITATAGTKSATTQLAFQAAKTITPKATSQIAVSSGYYTGGNITVAGDTNLVASNIKSGVSIFGVNGNYVGSGSGGGSGSSSADHSIEDGLVTRTITTYTNDRVTNIGNVAFYSYNDLTSVNFPICTSIGYSAFYGCANLTSVNFPACTSIGFNAFSYCRSLTSVNFPACTTIGNGAFGNCINLTSVNFPACTTIGNDVFRDCTNLTSVNFPACTSIGNSAFYSCTNLTSVNFPVCTSIEVSAFYYCTNLTSVNFPACTTIGNGAFGGCSGLTNVNFPVCTSIDTWGFGGCRNLVSATFGSGVSSTSVAIKSYVGSIAFSGCTKLTNLIFYHPSVITLSHISAFYSTPIANSNYTGSFGSIYVPASLVNAYKAATNWATYADRITAIPGTEDTGGDTGELIEFTINDVSYVAAKGMTWGDWVLSDYNSLGLIADEWGVTLGEEPEIEYIYDQDWNDMTSSDLIIAGYDYILDY